MSPQSSGKVGARSLFVGQADPARQDPGRRQTLADVIDRDFPCLQRRAASRGRAAIDAEDARARRDGRHVALRGVTPAGLGASCIVPLIEAGFVDWIVSTGANLYHDMHFAFNCKLVAGDFRIDDTALFEAGVVRIYDVLLSRDECLLATDQRLRGDPLPARIPEDDGHGRAPPPAGPVLRRGRGRGGPAPRLGARRGLSGRRAGLHQLARRLDDRPGNGGHPVRRLEARVRRGRSTSTRRPASSSPPRRRGKKSAVVLLGGGSPKNFMLQTAPHMHRQPRAGGRRGTTTSSRSPTPGSTPAGSPAPRPTRRSVGERSIRTACRTPCLLLRHDDRPAASDVLRPDAASSCASRSGSTASAAS